MRFLLLFLFFCPITSFSMNLETDPEESINKLIDSADSVYDVLTSDERLIFIDADGFLSLQYAGEFSNMGYEGKGVGFGVNIGFGTGFDDASFNAGYRIEYNRSLSYWENNRVYLENHDMGLYMRYDFGKMFLNLVLGSSANVLGSFYNGYKLEQRLGEDANNYTSIGFGYRFDHYYVSLENLMYDSSKMDFANRTNLNFGYKF